MKNKNITIASIISIAPFLIMAVFSVLASFFNFNKVFGTPGPEQATVMGVFFILCQIISIAIIVMGWRVKPIQGVVLLVVNIIVIMAFWWFIGFAHISG